MKLARVMLAFVGGSGCLSTAAADTLCYRSITTYVPKSHVQAVATVEDMLRTVGQHDKQQIELAISSYTPSLEHPPVLHGEIEFRWLGSNYYCKTVMPTINSPDKPYTVFSLCNNKVTVSKHLGGAIISSPLTEAEGLSTAHLIAFTNTIPADLAKTKEIQSRGVMQSEYRKSLFGAATEIVQIRSRVLPALASKEEIDTFFAGKDEKRVLSSRFEVARKGALATKIAVIYYSGSAQVSTLHYILVRRTAELPPRLGELLPVGAAITDLRLTPGAPMVKGRAARPVHYKWDGRLPSEAMLERYEAAGPPGQRSKFPVVAITVGIGVVILSSAAKVRGWRRLRRGSSAQSPA